MYLRSILLFKLASLNILQTINISCTSYLSNRFHSIFSMPSYLLPLLSLCCTSRIHSGSIIIFILHRSPSLIYRCSLIPLVDNLKFFSYIASPIDYVSLQLNLDTLVHWCPINELALNIVVGVLLAPLLLLRALIVEMTSLLPGGTIPIRM